MRGEGARPRPRPNGERGSKGSRADWQRADLGSIFAALYDRVMAATEEAGLAEHRQRLLAIAAGRVLEIGGGTTGANLPFFGKVSRNWSSPSRRSQWRAGSSENSRSTESRRASFGRRPSSCPSTPSFDDMVCTLVLYVADPLRALSEVRRVLRPQGRLLPIEHVRSEDPRLAGWQDRLRRPWSWFGCGCRCNRATVESLRAGVLGRRTATRNASEGAGDRAATRRRGGGAGALMRVTALACA